MISESQHKLMSDYQRLLDRLEWPIDSCSERDKDKLLIEWMSLVVRLLYRINEKTGIT